MNALFRENILRLEIILSAYVVEKFQMGSTRTSGKGIDLRGENIFVHSDKIMQVWKVWKRFESIKFWNKVGKHKGESCQDYLQNTIKVQSVQWKFNWTTWC